ncbi:MAG: tRNA (adenosine(37)-N6)-dimethylallyltransferase MiaA [Candidatus Amoebophilus sp. 36-38]|nr:MAG: tRNA (adenosine(37)-N6)-dimethylallyltransferase MiaA [Candidatus Amoebophilus sp. 36-38]
MKIKQLPNRCLIVVVGPTAVGKTDLCIQIAKYFQTEIVSADSRQYYQGMRIGTAQPTMEQRHQVVHHFIDCFPIDTFYSAGKFGQEALELINHLFNKHQSLILTGGSSLYVQAVCEGLDAMPDIPIALRACLNQRLQQEGIEVLRQELARYDPAYYQVVDLNNPQRIVRALEICLATGKTYSAYRLRNNPSNVRPFKIIKIGLDLDRKLLYERIDERVDQMVEQGLLEEVTALYPYKTVHALQTVGYQELFGYLDNQYSLEEAISLIKRNTRRYAKRQLTWFRKQTDIQWFHPNDLEAILAYINQVASC